MRLDAAGGGGESYGDGIVVDPMAELGYVPFSEDMLPAGSFLAMGELIACTASGNANVVCADVFDPHFSPLVVETVPLSADVRSLGVSAEFALGLGSTGNVLWWRKEYNRAPALSSPAAVPSLPPSRQIAAGRTGACALGVDGAVRCIAPTFASVGDGLPTFSGLAAPVLVVSNAVEVVVRPFEEDGTVAFSGGMGVVVGGTKAQVVDAVPGCARLASGEVTCWTRSLPPSPIPGITSAVRIAMSEFRACALLASGQVSCWSMLGSVESWWPQLEPSFP